MLFVCKSHVSDIYEENIIILTDCSLNRTIVYNKKDSDFFYVLKQSLKSNYDLSYCLYYTHNYCFIIFKNKQTKTMFPGEPHG